MGLSCMFASLLSKYNIIFLFLFRNMSIISPISNYWVIIGRVCLFICKARTIFFRLCLLIHTYLHWSHLPFYHKAIQHSKVHLQFSIVRPYFNFSLELSIIQRLSAHYSLPPLPPPFFWEYSLLIIVCCENWPFTTQFLLSFCFLWFSYLSNVKNFFLILWQFLKQLNNFTKKL